MKDMLTVLHSRMPSMSKGQRAIADFVTENFEEAAYMTAHALGQATGLSESTVVRFAVEMGFGGYPEFLAELRAFVKTKLTSVQRIRVTNRRIDKTKILESALSFDIDSIRKTAELCDEDVFSRAVGRILSARKIYIFGALSSNILARFLAHYFQLIFDNIMLVMPLADVEIQSQLMRISGDDLLFAISFPRYSNSTFGAAKFARGKGAQIVALTDSANNALAQIADDVLIARSGIAGFADSLVAPLSVINALIIALGVKREEQLTETFSRVEQLWNSMDVFAG